MRFYQYENLFNSGSRDSRGAHPAVFVRDLANTKIVIQAAIFTQGVYLG